MSPKKDIVAEATEFFAALKAAKQADVDQVFVLFIRNFFEEILAAMANPVKALSFSEKRQILNKLSERLSNEISRAIILGGERIELKAGQLLFEEGKTEPKIGNGTSQVFILVRGIVISRINALEASNQSTVYEPGQLLGVEKFITAIDETKRGKESVPSDEMVRNQVYHSSVIAGSAASLVGLSASDCISFLVYNPSSLRRVLREWIGRSLELEEQLKLMFQIAKGMEVDIQSVENIKGMVTHLIEMGEIDAIAGALLAMKKNLAAANEFLQGMEKDMREKQGTLDKTRKEAHELQQHLVAASGTVMELLAKSGKPFKHLAAVTDLEVDTLLNAIEGLDPEGENKKP